MRPLIAVLLLAASITAAHAFGLGLGNRFGHLGAPGKHGAAAPPQTGKILAVDGVSHILSVDGVSKICRAGGC